MARGGFHGGGHHTGGHHSGGFHGGGFHGGGFSGGFRSGGTHNRGSSNHEGDEGVDFLIGLGLDVGIRLGVPFGLYVLYLVWDNSIPGMNFVNLAIFVLSAVLFIIALKGAKRTSALNNLGEDYKISGGSYVWKDAASEGSGRIQDRNTWAEKDGKGYQIAFSDGKENRRIVEETMKRTPFVIWLLPELWLIAGILLFFVNFVFYEILIPIFENIDMTDAAFKFIDELIFYLPSVLTLACSIACLSFKLIKDALLYKCAIQIINNNKAIDERKMTEGFITSRIEEKWYYDTCPNCGADASHARRFCLFCGSSLEVLDLTKLTGKTAHKLPTED